MISSGGFTYGTIFCVGSLVQALRPASAAEAAANFSTSRRLIPFRIFRRIVRKLVFQELAVFLRFGQLLEALPETLAVFLCQLRADGRQVQCVRKIRIEVRAHFFIQFAFTGGTSSNLCRL